MSDWPVISNPCREEKNEKLARIPPFDMVITSIHYRWKVIRYPWGRSHTVRPMTETFASEGFRKSRGPFGPTTKVEDVWGYHLPERIGAE